MEGAWGTGEVRLVRSVQGQARGEELGRQGPPVQHGLGRLGLFDIKRRSLGRLS